jgi:hypothetical protein
MSDSRTLIPLPSGMAQCVGVVTMGHPSHPRRVGKRLEHCLKGWLREVHVISGASLAAIQYRNTRDRVALVYGAYILAIA